MSYIKDPNHILCDCCGKDFRICEWGGSAANSIELRAEAKKQKWTYTRPNGNKGKWRDKCGVCSLAP